MQSILLATPAKTTTNDVISDGKKVDSIEDVDAVKGEGESDSLDFSSILDSLIEGDADSLAKTEQENENLELESADEPVDDALLLSDESNLLDDSNLSDETDLSDETLTEEAELLLSEEGALSSQTENNEPVLSFNSYKDTELQKTSLEGATSELSETENDDLVINIEGQENSKEVDEDGNEAEAKITASDDTKDNMEDVSQQEENIIPIIAQIETAQKTDTNIAERKASMTIGEVELPPKEMKKGTKESLIKEDKSLLIGTLADDSELSESMAKELIAKDNLRTSEKMDAITAPLRSVVDKPIFNFNAESTGFQPIGLSTAVPEKLLNQTLTSHATSGLMQQASLQQPIDLHAKQASSMMGERILMMLGQGKQEVTIRLDPAELGSMHIKLQVQQDQLQVNIQTQLGQSRDMIEQNLPRLREQLAQQGINLGDTSVEQQTQKDQSHSQQSQKSELGKGLSEGNNESVADEQSQWLASQIPLPAQGIDYYV